MGSLRYTNILVCSCLLWIVTECIDNPLLVSPELIQVQEGEDIEAKCIVTDSGKSPPDYAFGWNLKDKKNGTAVEESSSGNIKTLRIQNARQQDAGFYSCRLLSDNRNIEKTLQISVTDNKGPAVYIPCRGKYQCKDSRRIGCSYRCDGRTDCPFGDDEEGCSKTKEIYPKESNDSEDHTAWLKTTVYTVIACTVGVVLFISIVVIAVCRIKMKRAAVRRAMHQAERRRRHGHHGSENNGRSRAERNNPVEQEPFISSPSSTHFGNIIVNVNNGVQYVPNVDIHTIIQSPPSYQEVLAESQRDALIGRHSPPPIYSTIDRNPYRLSGEIRENPNIQVSENSSTDRQICGNTDHDSNTADTQIDIGNRSERGERSDTDVGTNVEDRYNVPITNSDNNFQIGQTVTSSARDGTRSLERLCRNRQAGSRSRPNVRSIAAPRRPKQLQVRDGQIILDENSSASSSPETVNRNTQTNPADITSSQSSHITNPVNQNTTTQQGTGDGLSTRESVVSSPTQNKPAQLRVEAGQIVLEGQSNVQSLMTSSVTHDPDTATSSQGNLEVKDGHIVFKTP